MAYERLGVVGLITPWNAPVALAVVPIIQALMAENSVVHKPSEVTPFSALLLKRLTEDASSRSPPCRSFFARIQGGYPYTRKAEGGMQKFICFL